jgi:hypothetical protein
VGAACAALAATLIFNSPEIAQRHETTVQPKIDIREVEQALDDIDMLSQLQVVAPATQQKQTSERM